MQQYHGSVQDTRGNALPALVQVFQIGASNLAPIFADNGVTPTANPFRADADGEYRFYAANGRYTITTTFGRSVDTLPDVLIWDPVDAGIVSVADFGAVDDADEVTGTGTDSSDAVQRAIDACCDAGKALSVPGKYLITKELYIRKPILIYGEGAGSGYGENDLVDYQMRSGFVFTGAGVKRVRTRRKFRGSAADPQDAPLSVGINVQAEYVQFRDFAVFLHFNRADSSPTNYGADYDCGIFVGCRVHYSCENVHVLGYWREAAWYYDVTHATNLPRFNDPNGVPYDNTFNISGGDGCTMNKCYGTGGKWAVRVAGALPKVGQTTYSDPYYDEALGTTVSDNRGTFGFSDFTTLACSFYGTDHHSNYRRNDPSMVYTSDTAGGSMWIDGMAGNASGAVQGMRFLSTRFATFEAFKVRLGLSNRAQFIGCHIENRSSTSRKTTSGGSIAFDDTDTYGPITMEAGTRNVLVIGAQGALRPVFIDPAATYHDLFSASSSPLSRTTHDLNFGGRLIANSGELDLRSGSTADLVRVRNGDVTAATFSDAAATIYSSSVSLAGATATIKPSASSGVELDLRSASATDLVRLRGGSVTFLTVGPNGIGFASGTTACAIAASTGELDLRSAAGSAVRVRSGTATTATIDATAAAFAVSSSIRPTADNSVTAGDATHRYSVVYAGTGAINTSDERTKQQIQPIDEAALRAWSKVEYCQFKFNDAVEAKGDGARWHFGVIAQRVKEAFESEGLDAFAYGVLCYDEWDDEYEEEDGVRRLVRAAGNRYGVRYEEALVLECACLRSKLRL